MNIADKPMALETLQTTIPKQLPSDERNAAEEPPIIDCLKTIATPCPGTITSKSVARANEGKLLSSCDISPKVLA